MKSLSYILLQHIYSHELEQFPEAREEIEASFNQCHENLHAMLFMGVIADELLNKGQEGSVNR